MKKILFRKIFPYDPTFEGKYTRYEGYSLITLQKKSPGISKKLPINIKNKISEPIFSSILPRGIETAKIVSTELKCSQQSLAELNEVVFDLKSLVTEEEFNQLGSTLVRKRFIEGFINNTLMESRDLIQQRVNNLITFVKQLKDGEFLFISHSFFMKIFQIYILYPHLFEDPKIIEKFFDPTKKTFNFFEGFEIDL